MRKTADPFAAVIFLKTVLVRSWLLRHTFCRTPGSVPFRVFSIVPIDPRKKGKIFLVGTRERFPALCPRIRKRGQDR